MNYFDGKKWTAVTGGINYNNELVSLGSPPVHTPHGSQHTMYGHHSMLADCHPTCIKCQ